MRMFTLFRATFLFGISWGKKCFVFVGGGSALTDPTDLTVLPLWVGNLTEVVCGVGVCGVLSDDSECSKCSDY